ncbi:MAG: hypothetical protein IH983_09775 [Planctomycetes bacterium]|nr:hypothetical protein [Planctomycetota bacterium]
MSKQLCKTRKQLLSGCKDLLWTAMRFIHAGRQFRRWTNQLPIRATALPEPTEQLPARGEVCGKKTRATGTALEAIPTRV